ncbi:putative phosphatidate phosphatase [Culicoides brevitarsis]|uniref:putative phosphatidate phosphatase n=1 Tax=Culicoides brevitarsis TaxID=469753 RepID=UPI00307BDF8B
MEVVSVEADDLEIVDKKRPKNIVLKVTKIILLDIVLLVFYFFPVIIFYVWRQKVGFRTGFFCNDNSIRYPYVKSRISQGNIAAQSLLVAPVILIFSEILIQFRNKRQWSVIYARITKYFHGFFICMSFTYVPKLFRGTLRPHFMDVCVPNVDCSAPENQLRFIEDYECTGENNSIDVFMSFPSVHSAAASFIAIYLIFYFGTRVKQIKVRLCLQFLLLIYAYSIGLSRIAEHYHHTSDVIAGAAIGGLSAFASAKYFENFFEIP